MVKQVYAYFIPLALDWCLWRRFFHSFFLHWQRLDANELESATASFPWMISSSESVWAYLGSINKAYENVPGVSVIPNLNWVKQVELPLFLVQLLRISLTHEFCIEQKSMTFLPQLAPSTRCPKTQRATSSKLHSRRHNQVARCKREESGEVQRL